MPASPSLLILAAWVGLGLVYLGLGLLVCRAGRFEVRDGDGWFLAFWLGWVGGLFVLQVWHLALPIDERALATLAAAGAAGFTVQATSGALTRWRTALRALGRDGPALGVLVLAAAWLSRWALDGPHHGDAGAYFIPTVRWLIEHPIVRGLGNLYVPLAFNQSHFLYVAMLEVGPFVHGSYHVANGLLILALFGRSLLGVHRLVRSAPTAPADVFYALFLPVVVHLARGVFLTAPSPDLPVFVLGVVVSGALVTLLTRPAPGVGLDFFAIVVLATGGVTVKLSFAGLAAAIVPLATVVYLVRERPGVGRGGRAIAVAAAAAACGFVPWVIRNVLLSGSPFYPSGFGALPVEWRVPADAVQWIKAPMEGGPVWVGWRDHRWFMTRLDSLGWLAPEVLVPAAIVLAATVVGAVRVGIRLVRRRPPAPGSVPVVVLVPAVASLLFVGAAAPMPHYGGAAFWLVAVEAVVLALGDGAHGVVGRRLVAAVVLAVAGVVLVGDGPLLADVRDFVPLPQAQLSEARLPSGLVVSVPQYGQCWEAPLPCTPSPDPALRLRRAGDLGSGFWIDPSIQGTAGHPEGSGAPADGHGPG